MSFSEVELTICSKVLFMTMAVASVSRRAAAILLIPLVAVSYRVG